MRLSGIQVCVAIAVGLAYLAAISIDGLGGFWEDSFLFIGTAIFLILFRLLIRIKNSSWTLSFEWMFVPIYLLLIPSLWWWVKSGSHAFVILFGICISSWLLYIHSLISERNTDQ